MNTFFTADQHFFHKNIIDLCQRPFSGPDKMNKTIIDNYNSVVGKDDVVYFLGDVCWAEDQQKIKKVIERLNGRKILILGNHDLLKPFAYIYCGFESVHTSLDIGEYVLAHDPAVATMDTKRQWITGHVHQLYKKVNNVINVGVDVWDFYPVSLETIKAEFGNKEIPAGLYCYTYVDNKQVTCPYWSLQHDKPYMENGYCSFLNKGDWEDSNSLLWDRCKECSINTEEENENTI